MSGKNVFRKKSISEQAVATAEAIAAAAPIVADPRVSLTPAVESAGTSQQINLGSNQDLIVAAPGQIVEAPLSRVRSNPFNPRALYTNAAVDEMAVSMSVHGQRVAALGYLEEDGNVVLIEGETRLRGARAAGLTTLRVEIREKPSSDRELYELARAANVERREQTPLDDAIRWKELLAKKIYPTQVALARSLGLGEDLVSRTLSLAQLPQKIILVVSEYPELMNLKMLNALREFCEQTGEEETIQLIHEASRSGMGYRDVIARRKVAAKGPLRRPRSIREPLVFNNAKGEIKMFDEDGRLEVVLKGLSPEDANVLLEKIKAIFPKQT